MKKELLSLISLLMLIQIAYGSDVCSVLGVREPNSNIYDGPTWCQEVHLNEILVRGPFSINDSAISGETEVSGPIQSFKTQFKNIVIDANHTSNKVILKNKSNVSGDVVFKGIKGEVDIDCSSKVKGKIVNADVHRVE